MARQLKLLPAKAPTAAQRKAWIRERLHGLEFRQAARNERRRRERQGHGEESSDLGERQLTIAELLDHA